MKYVKQSVWIELKKELIEDKIPRPLCKLCRLKNATDLHHAVINKAKVRDKKMHKYLDVKENALEVCNSCNTEGDDWLTRVQAYRINAKRYGKEHMREWYDNLPLLIKEEMP